MKTVKPAVQSVLPHFYFIYFLFLFLIFLFFILQPSHSTLLVTPLKTSIIDCTEVSASFNSQGIAGMEYYADLYQLAQVHAQPSSLEKQRSINPLLRDNVAAILMAIRPLSFC